MTDAVASLTHVLIEARLLLARDGNDFSWSSWESPAAALREIDGLIAALRARELPKRLDIEVLFAVTGPIQEVSLSSGWAAEFVALATRLDEALARAYEP